MSYLYYLMPFFIESITKLVESEKIFQVGTDVGSLLVYCQMFIQFRNWKVMVNSNIGKSLAVYQYAFTNGTE